MKIPYQFRHFFFATAAPLLLLCSKPYNPFSDYSNAATVFTHQSVKSGDTVEVFRTDTLTAIVLVKELVDSFTVTAAGNRLWGRADSTIRNGDFGGEPFSILVSFNDTGRKSISFLTFTSNGRRDTCKLGLYVTSPLHQTGITAGFGDSITLRTAPVKDRDVYYYWSFGAGTRYSSRACSLSITLLPAILIGKGCLWVSDGSASSCVDTFDFLIRDTAAPSIVCVNENFVGKDTILTGDSVFNFKVRISNRGDQWVDSASIGKRPFDRIDNKVYYSLIDKMYTHDQTRPLEVTVFALGHFGGGAASEKRFTLIFSPDIVPALPAQIKVLMPSKDSTVTLLRRSTISGIVENHSFDSLNLLLVATLNDSLLSAAKALTGGRVCAWDWSMDLAPGPNRITLFAKDASTLSTLHHVSFTLVFADTAHDSAAPRIIAITADGAAANNFYTEKAIVRIGVRAFDEISGIDTLTMNGKPCALPDSGSWFYDSIALRHVRSGNEVLIRAVDKKRNDTTAEAVVFRNRLPVVQRFPSAAFIAVDADYSDTIVAFDPDMDSVAFELSAGPPGLSVNREGLVTWRPTHVDTGAHQITVRLWDGYQPLFRTYMVWVFGDGHPGPVRFATKAEDFPSFLEAGKDTLRTILHVAAATGVRPLLYSCRIVNKGKTVVSENPDSALIWAPQPQDTGFMQLMICVKDAFPSGDTLYPRILVLQGNRPCSLAVRFSADTTPAGALDLNRNRNKVTLTFTIHDPDNPLVERHDVSMLETRTRMTSIIDSAVVDTFSLVLDPLAFSGYDTIIAVVRDRAGTADTILRRIYYGMPPYAPQALYPVNLQTIGGESVTLSWQDVDPDGDSLSFDVYFGTVPDHLALVDVTRGTTFLAEGLLPQRTYYWRVVGRDWKSFTESPLWQFTTR